ncbi:hypothetical protein P872_21870 [Rhodonellum psychrophilum GCM71 = DSM 17998]|uniref:Type VII secretion system protein EssD-like domain-containing protein n=2 Tax=Rhodonellum TaxID=336827 RepID=U5BJ37_9BACT|nr:MULTISPECIES: DNA/RNA non-specific endonuclease [Rhodonellum]ERM80430.1 hypothetical protein P872_21870 [Rhodonellum psychrophilum GCM71 = DSM 17998]SDZ24782.1 DNA/RNA non-specific endonuclease [Rhodonellum ikkaensis]
MKTILTIVVVIFLASCKNTAREMGGEGLKKSVKLIENIVSPTQSNFLKNSLGDDVFQKLLKENDDEVLKRLAKNIENNPALNDVIINNTLAVKVLELMGNSPVRNNHLIVKYFSDLMAELGEVALKEKYFFTEAGERILLKSKKNGSVLAEISETAIIAKPGKGGLELNEFLAEKYMIPHIPYKIRGHKYVTNEIGQYKEVSGTFVPPIFEPTPLRNNVQQGLSKKYKDAVAHTENGQISRVKAGYPDYKDDGGHFIGNRLGGGSEMYNYIPMSKKLNRPGGGWFEMERVWLDAIKKGNKVNYKIEPVYNSNSKRPDFINVTYEIDGKRTTELFNNNIF